MHIAHNEILGQIRNFCSVHVVQGSNEMEFDLYATFTLNTCSNNIIEANDNSVYRITGQNSIVQTELRTHCELVSFVMRTLYANAMLILLTVDVPLNFKIR